MIYSSPWKTISMSTQPSTSMHLLILRQGSKVMIWIYLPCFASIVGASLTITVIMVVIVGICLIILMLYPGKSFFVY